MGLLTVGGEPLVWGTPANVKAIPYVLEHGISQFLLLFDRFKSDSGRPFLWGEEIEALVVQYGTTDSSDAGGPQFRDAPRRTVRLALSAAELLHELEEGATAKDAVWHPEYGSFMIESTPHDPYAAGSVDDVMAVEVNLRRRYEDAARVAAGHNQTVVTLTAFPLMGRPDFIAQGKDLHTRGEYADSLFVPDEVTNGTHPRFKNLTRNIRLRRGRKVCIQVPMYLDTHTLSRAVDPTYRIDRHPANKDIDCAPDLGAAKTGAFEDSSSDTEPDTTAQKTDQPAAGDEEKKFKAEFKHLFTPATHYYYAQYLNRAEQQQLRVRERFDACPCPVPAVSHPCIYMDGMAFGMGMCCLQVTMQLADLPQARHVYDQLAVVCPAFLALSSATPVQKGMLCDSDVRWLTISASVDDRKRDEVPRIVKSRYDHISCFISDRTRHLESFNDDHVEMDPTVLDRLKAHGIDERLASHFAHLFIRDPLVIFDKLIDVDDTKTSVHFENIQSTNWQSLRFKPPPMEGGPGWRVEFRVMDIQMTPFENAAYSVFIALLTRAFIKYDSFLYVPMSMVDENMGRAHLREPVQSQKFWARKSNTFTDAKPSTDDYAEYTIDELFNGSADGPEGYIPLVRRFIVEELTHGGPVPPRLEAYLRLLSRRASGELQTTASFLRSFVTQHPAYQHDSIVAPEIACDMVKLAEALSRGEVAFDGFLPQDLVMEARKRERE